MGIIGIGTCFMLFGMFLCIKKPYNIVCSLFTGETICESLGIIQHKDKEYQDKVTLAIGKFSTFFGIILILIGLSYLFQSPMILVVLIIVLAISCFYFYKKLNKLIKDLAFND